MKLSHIYLLKLMASITDVNLAISLYESSCPVRHKSRRHQKIKKYKKKNWGGNVLNTLK